MARDCTVNRDPNAPPLSGPSPPMIKERIRFGVCEFNGGARREVAVGSGSGEPGRTLWAGPSTGHDITAGGSSIPPWRRPEVWQTNNPLSNSKAIALLKAMVAGMGAPRPGMAVLSTEVTRKPPVILNSHKTTIMLSTIKANTPNNSRSALLPFSTKLSVSHGKTQLTKTHAGLTFFKWQRTACVF